MQSEFHERNHHTKPNCNLLPSVSRWASTAGLWEYKNYTSTAICYFCFYSFLGKYSWREWNKKNIKKYLQSPGKAELLHALHIMSQYVCLWMYLSFPSLKLLSLHRTSQGALQGGGISSHSYSSTSYSHGQSGDKTGKKHLPKRILIYPVPMAFIFYFISFLVNTIPCDMTSTFAIARGIKPFTIKSLNFKVS